MQTVTCEPKITFNRNGRNFIMLENPDCYFTDYNNITVRMLQERGILDTIHRTNKPLLKFESSELTDMYPENNDNWAWIYKGITAPTEHIVLDELTKRWYDAFLEYVGAFPNTLFDGDLRKRFPSKFVNTEEYLRWSHAQSVNFWMLLDNGIIAPKKVLSIKRTIEEYNGERHEYKQPLAVNYGFMTVFYMKEVVTKLDSILTYLINDELNNNVSTCSLFKEHQKEFREMRDRALMWGYEEKRKEFQNMLLKNFLLKFLELPTKEDVTNYTDKMDFTIKIDTKVTMGADPEFELYHITHGKRGKRMLDFRGGFVQAPTVIRNDRNGELGLDGIGTIMEIRPRYNANTKIVAKNVRKIFQTLSERIKSMEMYCAPLAGGGFRFSTGGHIHLGNKSLKGIDVKTEAFLGKMLDAFLYYPIRTNLPMAKRQWSSSGKIAKDYEFHNSYECAPRNINCSNEKIYAVAKEDKGGTRVYTDYDTPSAFREQAHGLEYRSLPSFCIDYQFTRIVLKIAQKITEKLLQCAAKKDIMSFNNPPTEEDYIQYITPKEYEVFCSYLYGKNNDKITNDLFRNWRIKLDKPSVFEVMFDLKDSYAICGGKLTEILKPMVKSLQKLDNYLSTKFDHIRVTFISRNTHNCEVPFMFYNPPFGYVFQDPETISKANWGRIYRTISNRHEGLFYNCDRTNTRDIHLFIYYPNMHAILGKMSEELNKEFYASTKEELMRHYANNGKRLKRMLNLCSILISSVAGFLPASGRERRLLKSNAPLKLKLHEFDINKVHEEGAQKMEPVFNFNQR